MAEGGGVLLPSTLEEELALLAALMGVEGACDEVLPRLQVRHFSDPVLARIYEAIGKLAGDDQPVNPVTVMRAMDGDPGFADLGGGAYWMRRIADPMVYYAVGHLNYVIDVAERRALQSRLLAGADAVADRETMLDVCVADVEDALTTAVAPSVDQRTYTMGTAFTGAIERIDALARGEIEPGILVDGLQDWNDITGGMQPGDLIYLAGRPSMGKTALALGVARRAVLAGHGALFISREMGIDQLMPRLLADMIYEAGGAATFDDVKRGKVSTDDMALLRQLEAQVRDWPLVIVDPDAFGAEQLGPLIRRHKRAMARDGIELGLVVVDYLGLIDAPYGKPNREQEVTAISKAMKGAARSNRVPVMVLSQLSRAVEQREDKRPMLSDLRDSGSLEQDADLVIFVYREEYYLQRSEPDAMDVKKRPAWEESMRAASNRIEIYSAKNRQGDLCRRKSWFFGAHQAVRNSDFYYRFGGHA